MATVKHPFTGDKPVLVEEYSHVGVWTFSVERTARYRRTGTGYKVREMFASIRPAYNANGFLDSTAKGVVVTRNDFGEIRSFPDFFTAKTYVESLFALEHAAG